jgi:N-acyl-D-amino-acid deacylase
MMMHRWIALALMVGFAGCGPAPSTDTQGTGAADTRYDVLIRNGLVYDGSGAAPQEMDVAVNGDRVVALLPRTSGADAVDIVDAQGRAVAPGFINVLSWATESLIADGRGMSDTLQGITLEIFGEGWSMGPLNPDMKAEAQRRQGDIEYAIDWTSLGEYLEYLERRGITPNVASFIGATTVRTHELGEADVQPDAQQLRRMQDLVRQAMREGALGVGSSLIYPPAFFAKTDELIALSQAAAEFGGGYISHMRSEANQLLRAVDEIVSIGRATGERVEIYHFKAAGEKNWPAMADAIAKVEAARDEGVLISANMYAYTAGATGLTAGLPPWVQDGGHAAMVERLRDPSIRARVIAEMKEPSDDWENLHGALRWKIRSST